MRRVAISMWLTALAACAEPQVRCRNFTVNPSTGPVGEVEVRAGGAWSGTVSITPPAGWSIDPAAFEVALAADETRSLSYRVLKAREEAENAYRFVIAVSGGSTSTQTVRTASAPYGAPKIDGRLGDEWKDAIPLRFETRGKRTAVRTYWNERSFCVSVEVEEQALVPSNRKRADGAFDAVQLVVGAKGAKAARHEFLIEPTGKSKAACRRLASAQAPAGSAQSEEAVAVPEAQAAVRHGDGVTAYELLLPLEALEGVRVDAGREFTFSLLVHDPDGTGLRDLGSAMNRPETERRAQPACWTTWDGGCWAGAPPFDGGSEFGFCSSVH